PWARLLLDRVDLAPGEAVLDVACGPGSVTRLAAAEVGSGGQGTRGDISAAMLTIARAKPVQPRAPPRDHPAAPGDGLPVRDAEFDAVVCQQGLQFFPDRPAELAEMRRAVRPGGRLAIAVWAQIELAPAFAALERAIRGAAGDAVADRYRNGPWGMPRAAELRTLLRDAGFDEVHVTRETLPLVFEGGARQLVSRLAGTAVAGAGARAQK